MRAVIATLSGLALAVSLVACGEDDQPRQPQRTTVVDARPKNLVTASEVEAARAGSPERAVLEWFQAAQFGDTLALRRLSTDRSLDKIEDANLRAILRLAGPSLGKPRIDKVSVEGNTASIRLLLLSYNGDKLALSQPASLPLRRVAGVWQIDDFTLLTTAADAIARQRSGGG